MAQALSMDLRTRVLAAIAGGVSCRQAATHFGVSASSDPLAQLGARARRRTAESRKAATGGRPGSKPMLPRF